MNHRFSEGILQVATGEKYQDEAIANVKRFRPYLNNRPITLITDNPERIPSGLYDRVIEHKQAKQSYRDKILPLLPKSVKDRL